MKKLFFLLLPVFALLSGCKTDYANLPTYSGARQLQAVIEVPAGSSHRLIYNRETKEFVNDKKAGLDRVIPFLPYLANFGFIPSTEISSNGNGLKILVIAESREPGTVMEVIPLGVMQLETAGELEHVVVAVPARPSEQLISATDFASFSKQYPGIKSILQTWFTHYNPTAHTTFVGWRNERFADEEIQRWMKL
ncbi:inorganic diphosphatase [Pontibacter sp. 172403-2]|uniref:inorganic diphosphatase n=1 Tax=Pontibacter rufus TaxID=2791028 RepID=UPI0018AF80F4|nr:inorganic diphosphatase [Pontibacter sp. 172403-2]MBF9255239.1 inorganic diphosphatase [Pontibacter sp. 172403-2]